MTFLKNKNPVGLPLYEYIAKCEKWRDKLMKKNFSQEAQAAGEKMVVGQSPILAPTLFFMEEEKFVILRGLLVHG